MSTFRVNAGNFELDGIPMRVFSGAMHYFRILPELWDDRFRKLKAMGLNTLETYFAWNLHEPHPGEFNFSGMCDVERYLDLAARHDLKVIVRPGPYICSEWDFGALPGWLTTIPGIRLRCHNAPYLDAVRRYFDVLLPKLGRFSCGHGGPVIMIQTENEYGSYGNDHSYLRAIEEMYEPHFPGVLRVTSDGPTDLMLTGGTLPETAISCNFGSNAKKNFEFMEAFRPGEPKLCMEFWNGWFDHWGEQHHSRASEDAGAALKELLEANGHVSFYMFHGGTNFGFTNGANCDGPKHYMPTVSSYDDDAPLNEHGAPTEKYETFRRILAEYGADVDLNVPVPPALPVTAYGKVRLDKKARLAHNLDRLSTPHQSATPLYMEELGQNFGFIHYETVTTCDSAEHHLLLDGLRDRAQIFVNDDPRGTLYCNDAEQHLLLNAKTGDRVSILVENMGRSNYGPMMEENARKGMDKARLGGQTLFGWTIRPLPLESTDGLRYEDATTPDDETPCFYKGEFEVFECADTFLKIPGKKGIAFLNGFHLGRYWEIGPTHTLYVPAPLLRKGVNTIEIFELHALSKLEVEFTDTPEL